MKNMHIRTKMVIFGSSAGILCILILVLSVIFSNKTKIGSSAYQDISKGDALIADIIPPSENIIKPYTVALRFINSSDPDERTSLLKEFKSEQQSYEAEHKYWEKNIPDNKDLKRAILVDSYNTAEEFFNIFNNSVVAAVDKQNTTEIYLLQSSLTSVFSNHEDSITKAVKLANQWRDGKVASANSMSSSSNKLVLTIMIVGIALGSLLNVFVSRSIIKPLMYITKICNKIADGDLSSTIDKRYLTREETGQLCMSTQKTLARLNGYISYINEITEVLNKMAIGDFRIKLKNDYAGEFSGIKSALLKISASLGNSLSNINSSAAQVQNGSSQVSDSAQSLAQGASEQAGTIEKLSSSINDISKKIYENSTLLGQASGNVQKASDGVDESNAEMAKMLEAMENISTSSSEIKKIIKVINDIAFQTNILALNAAVEAARAGEAGKGFSVVADEVRNLASKSASAAKQTGELIEKSAASVSAGSDIARETAEKLKNVAEKTRQAKNMIKDVDTASQSQVETIKQINKGIGQISSIVQTNSAAAEENASSSEELSQLAVMLLNESSKFKFNGGMDKAPITAVAKAS